MAFCYIRQYTLFCFLGLGDFFFSPQQSTKLSLINPFPHYRLQRLGGLKQIKTSDLATLRPSNTPLSRSAPHRVLLTPMAAVTYTAGAFSSICIEGRWPGSPVGSDNYFPIQGTTLGLAGWRDEAHATLEAGLHPGAGWEELMPTGAQPALSSHTLCLCFLQLLKIHKLFYPLTNHCALYADTMARFPPYSPIIPSPQVARSPVSGCMLKDPVPEYSGKGTACKNLATEKNEPFLSNNFQQNCKYANNWCLQTNS